MTAPLDIGNLLDCMECGTRSMVTAELLSETGIAPGSTFDSLTPEQLSEPLCKWCRSSESSFVFVECLTPDQAAAEDAAFDERVYSAPEQDADPVYSEDTEAAETSERLIAQVRERNLQDPPPKLDLSDLD